MIKLENIRGAIFDMDGTLIDSMKMWENIASEYLIQQGIVPEENLGKVLKNMSLQQGTEYVIEKYSLTKSVTDVIEGINTLVLIKYEKELQAKEGVIELIQRLDKKKVAMCVATASDYSLAKLCLERIGILPYLKGIYTCGDIGAGKEDPMLFEHALDKLGTNKENTYVFEDSLYALNTAKKAGFKVIAVYDEFSGKDEKALKEQADIYVKIMSELW